MWRKAQSVLSARSELPTANPLHPCQEGFSGTYRAMQCFIMNASCLRYWPGSRELLLLLVMHNSFSLDHAKSRRAPKQIRKLNWRTILIVDWWCSLLAAVLIVDWWRTVLIADWWCNLLATILIVDWWHTVLIVDWWCPWEWHG